MLAGGDLQHPGPDGVAPLVDQRRLAVVVDHQGGHGPVVLDHLALARAAVLAGDPVGPDRDDRALERPWRSTTRNSREATWPAPGAPRARRRRQGRPGPAGRRRSPSARTGARRPPSLAGARGQVGAQAGRPRAGRGSATAFAGRDLRRGRLAVAVGRHAVGADTRRRGGGRRSRSSANAVAAPTKSRNRGGAGSGGSGTRGGTGRHEPRVVGQLDHLDQAAVGRGPEDQPGVLQPAPEAVVDLVAVAVPLEHQPVAVGPLSPRPLDQAARVEPEAHGAALVGDAALVGQQVDHRVRGVGLELAELAPSRPARLRAISITAVCRPRQMPR